MMNSPPTVIELTEHGPPAYFDRDDIPPEAAEILYDQSRNYVDVEFPSPKTDGRWLLAGRGWVGYIPVSPDLGVSLKPKVKLANLFAMLEWAYRLRSFRFLQGFTTCSTLSEFYERLANVLARRVLDRSRRGLYRTYLKRDERLPYVRGRIDVQAHLRRPSQIGLRCHYEEHTADIEENQILTWALRVIARSSACTDRALPSVRKAYRSLQGFVSLRPCGARMCVGRRYNRLNSDYEILHALCRFFLENSGPSHERGDRSMLPFLVNMPRLYELFVAEWARAHLPAKLCLRSQESAYIDDLLFKIDLVVYDTEANAPACVLDTKYKAVTKPSTDDVAKIVTYAEVKGCREAVLVYPVPLQRPLDALIGGIHVRTLTFALDDNLDQAGNAFLSDLLHAGH